MNNPTKQLWEESSASSRKELYILAQSNNEKRIKDKKYRSDLTESINFMTKKMMISRMIELKRKN